MEPLVIILVPGILGGVIMALLISLRRADSRRLPVDRPLEQPSPTLINMAHIRVEGIGGLGMVAGVVAVALVQPQIRSATILGALLGGLLAVALIAIRRRAAAEDPGADDPGARSVLGLDEDLRRRSRPRSPGHPRLRAAGVGA